MPETTPPETTPDTAPDTAPNLLVTDEGFAPDDWRTGFTPLADLAAAPGGDDAEGDAAGDDSAAPVLALDLAPGDDPAALAGRLDTIDMIRVAFPGFSDGRGFTIARNLRRMGYQGRLRAAGHVIADQYAMARRAGFDEVEISPDLAARQPEEQWLFRADWTAHDYQSRLRA